MGSAGGVVLAAGQTEVEGGVSEGGVLIALEDEVVEEKQKEKKTVNIDFRLLDFSIHSGWISVR